MIPIIRPTTHSVDFHDSLSMGGINDNVLLVILIILLIAAFLAWDNGYN